MWWKENYQEVGIAGFQSQCFRVSGALGKPLSLWSTVSTTQRKEITVSIPLAYRVVGELGKKTAQDLRVKSWWHGSWVMSPEMLGPGTGLHSLPKASRFL